MEPSWVQVEGAAPGASPDLIMVFISVGPLELRFQPGDVGDGLWLLRGVAGGTIQT